MTEFKNYHEEAKSLLLIISQENMENEKQRRIDEDEHGDMLQALFIVSDIVNAHYSQEVVRRKGTKILTNKTYFDQVNDQVDIYLDSIMKSPVLGIDKERIPSKSSLKKIASRLRLIR